MRRADTIELGHKLLGYLESGTTYVADSVTRNPVTAYLDESQWRVEREVLFRRQPVVVAMTAQIREPGDWVTFELPDLPVLVVRGEDGVVRAFINACRHRGVAVCQQPQGHGRKLVCPFHAWTYDTAGVLDAIRSHPLGRDAAIVGECVSERPGFVVLDTGFGSRLLSEPEGELLPRIC